ncbi:MAG: hypothetical protein FRX49_09149 [Trebouxia sp. A1-2]|nr:MAG: hypothetical protein FRX49_09149 [Trebouxia sp. A1-2]
MGWTGGTGGTEKQEWGARGRGLWETEEQTRKCRQTGSEGERVGADEGGMLLTFCCSTSYKYKEESPVPAMISLPSGDHLRDQMPKLERVTASSSAWKNMAS